MNFTFCISDLLLKHTVKCSDLTINTSYLTVAEGQGRDQQGLQSNEGLTRAGEFASRVAHCHDWRLVLVAEASVSCHIDLSMGLLECPHDTVAGFFQSEGPKGKQDGIHVFYDLVFRSHT